MFLGLKFNAKKNSIKVYKLRDKFEYINLVAKSKSKSAQI